MNCPHCNKPLFPDGPTVQESVGYQGTTYHIEYGPMKFNGTARALADHMAFAFEMCVRLRLENSNLQEQLRQAHLGPNWEAFDDTVKKHVSVSKAAIEKKWAGEVIDARESRDKADARVRELEAELARKTR